MGHGFLLSDVRVAGIIFLWIGETILWSPMERIWWKDFNYWEYKLVRFLKDSFSCCEWFIETADFGDFRKVKHNNILIIFSLYRLFHTKTLIFTVFEMSNFVLTKQHLREILIFCFNWKKSAEAHRMLVEVYGDTALIP